MPSCSLACDFPAASGAVSLQLFSLGSAWAWGRGATQAMTSQDCDVPWAPPPFTKRSEIQALCALTSRSGRAGFASAQLEQRVGLPFKECCDLTSPRRVTSLSLRRRAQREPRSP